MSGMDRLTSDMEEAFRRHLAANPYAADLIKRIAFEIVPMARRASQAAPAQPTEAMLNAARDWSDAKYGKPIGNDAAIGCWNAMLAAAPAVSAARDAMAICKTCGGEFLLSGSHDCPGLFAQAAPAPSDGLREALEAIRDGYGPNHLSKFALAIASAALMTPAPAQEVKP